MSEELLKAAISKNTQEFAKIFREELFANMKKEEPTMQVSYNGFTGRLEKLERKITAFGCGYDISIYDSEKRVTYSLTGVNLEDVKFIGGAVSFSG